jgi:hypothetical protein
MANHGKNAAEHSKLRCVYRGLPPRKLTYREMLRPVYSIYRDTIPLRIRFLHPYISEGYQNIIPIIAGFLTFQYGAQCPF